MGFVFLPKKMGFFYFLTSSRFRRFRLISPDIHPEIGGGISVGVLPITLSAQKRSEPVCQTSSMSERAKAALIAHIVLVDTIIFSMIPPLESADSISPLGQGANFSVSAL